MIDMFRRHLLKGGLAAAAGSVLAAPALAQAFPFKPNQRYPDPAVEILDPSFAKYRIYSSTIEQLGSGMRWAEGPVYFPEGRYLLVSDIPNNRIMKYDEVKNSFSVFRENANYANGNARDRQGRLVTCEHSVTRRITRTEKNGRITVLADKFEGKRLNAPNDVVVRSDDTIWFTDPLFGINGEWEGSRAKPEQATTNVYRLAPDGKLTAVITDLVNPNGLAFSTRREEALCRRVARHAEPQHLELRCRRRRQGLEQGQAGRRCRFRRPRRLPRRSRRQSLVRLWQQWRAQRRAERCRRTKRSSR